MPSSVEVWLWLLLVMLPHNPRTMELLEHYGSAESLARAIRDGECPKITESEKHRARNTHTRDVRQIMEECAANDIRIITLDDEEYPVLLRNIYSPPIVLFVRGMLSCLSDEVSLAVVRLGTVLVSGLALGIDTVAHTSAVNAGVPTVGVLACGQLVNYPPDNAGLKNRIIEGGGALVSELLPHAGVEARYFRDRNRIISGLGLGTLVVEASTRSGCLLTANHAVDQGRDLFCVPPTDITQEWCAGVVPFLRDGAIPVFDYLDIVNEYMYHYLSRIGTDDSSERQHRNPQKKPRSKPAERPATPRVTKAAPPADPVKSTQPADVAPAEESPKLSEEKLSGLTELQVSVAKIVESAAQSADEVIAISGISYAEAAEVLMDLELADIIKLMPDGKYHLK